MITINAQLIASEKDLMGYETYVFKNLESAPFGHNYVMCVRFPNWDHKKLEIGDTGYLTYREVVAGIDYWYDPISGDKIPYNYSNLIFIKFVPQTSDTSKEIIL